MAERDLVVRFIGDDRDLQRAFRTGERGARQFESRFTRLNQSLRGGVFGSGIGTRGALLFGSGAFISSAAITAALTKSVEQAVNLNEEISKSREIFEESSAALEDWSRSTARDFGIAQAEALKATGTFGNLFRVVGLVPQQASEMSRALVELAADLASFNNADPSEVLTAIRSGLIGEAEPLRRYGVLLSEARVQQEALATTGKTNVKALTDQEKALARYQIILQDTAPAQGDFARTSEGLANQSRILRAQLNDLAGNIGQLLVPVLTDAAEAANLLFEALEQMRGVDFSPGFDFPDPPDWVKDITGLAAAGFLVSPAGALAVGIKRALEEAAEEIEEATRPDDLAGPRGPGGIAATNVRLAIEERERQLKEAERSLRRSRRTFQAFLKGLGLKLDKAGLSQTLDDDIAALREIERAIQRQIAREGRTFALVEQLTAIRQQISDTVAQRAEDQARRSEQAFRDVIDALDLKLEAASATRGLADDLRALRALETAITKRISEEGRSLDLQRELLRVRQQQAEIARQQAEQLREAREGRQFEALGLTVEGQQRTPSTQALRRRLGTLQEQVKGTVLDTAQTREQLQRIGRVLSGQFGAVGKDVREAILRMFREISDALDKGGQTAPITKFQKRGIDQLVEGLGLSAEEIKALRQRFSQLGPSGTAPGAGTGAFGFAVTAGGGGNVIVNGDIVVQDPRDADAFVREVQKQARRNAGGRRGPRAGRR